MVSRGIDGLRKGKAKYRIALEQISLDQQRTGTVWNGNGNALWRSVKE